MRSAHRSSSNNCWLTESAQCRRPAWRERGIADGARHTARDSMRLNVIAAHACAVGRRPAAKIADISPYRPSATA